MFVSSIARRVAALALSGVMTVAAIPAARAADPALNVSITTMRMIIPGMPKFQLPPGVTLPPGINPDPTASRRMLIVTLSSPNKPPDDAAASLDVPEGLGLGKSLTLGIVRAPGGQAPGGEASKVTLESYWGSSATIQPGQPKEITVDPSNLPRGRFGRPGGGSGAAAMWPQGRDFLRSNITENASVAGDYSLDSSFAGGAKFHIDPNQQFLAPVELTSPTDRPDLNAAIAVSWKPVPHALAYSVMAIGSKPGANGAQPTSIMWNAGNASIAGLFQGNTQGDPVQALKEGAMLAPDATTATIPAGVLKDLEGAVVIVTAYGPSQTIAGSPSVHVVTTSMATMVLGGRGFGGRGFGGPPGGPPGGGPPGPAGGAQQ